MKTYDSEVFEPPYFIIVIARRVKFLSKKVKLDGFAALFIIQLSASVSKVINHSEFEDALEDLKIKHEESIKLQ